MASTSGDGELSAGRDQRTGVLKTDGLNLNHSSNKSDREEEIAYDIPFMQNLKRNDTNELIYKTEIDSQAERTSLQLGED